MFFLYHHNDLGRLVERLGELIERDAPGPLVTEQVLVPSSGMERWVRAELAQRAGVLANVDFPLPANFIWKSVVREGLGVEDDGRYFRDQLVWHLYRLLPAMAGEIDAVHRYLEAEPADVQRWQLADRLAGVFDRYQVFRGDMILDWDRGAASPGTEAARWQSAVWRGLVKKLGPDHRVRVLRDAVQRLLRGNSSFLEKWRVSPFSGRVFLFGLSDLPSDYLRLFYALSRNVDVHLFFQNPCEEYWGDVTSHPVALDVDLEGEDLPGETRVGEGHRLLASLGRPTREFLHLLYSAELVEILEPSVGDGHEYARPSGPSLLARVQRGVVAMNPFEEAGEVGTPDDDASIQVHACHGPMREVQVLHDQLLDLLARDPSLHPREIVVFLPRMDDYAPAVRSVFGGAEGRRAIPYSLSDQERRATHPIVQTLLDLLDLPVSRWTASRVLTLMAVPAILRRFGLEEGDVVDAARWLGEAGVRWGLDRTTRETMGAGDFEENTWRFGLDRLLLGSVLADESALVANVAPWPDVEGGAADALGRLWELVRRLEAWQKTLETPRPPREWRRELNALVEAVFRVDRDDPAEVAALDTIQEAQSFLDTADACMPDEDVSWLALREALRQAFDVSGPRQPLISGGVTFCGVRSLSGVPFRVVCMLGMNDGDFPRQDPGRGFDLTMQRRRLGDLTNRDTDRLAFLQALLAAKDVFYLSYTGVDVRSGERLEPSTTVAEFLDFLHEHAFRGQSRTAFEDRLVTRQPMQPFSRRYFEKDRAPRVFTFRGEWREGSLAQAAIRGEMPPLLDGSRDERPPSDPIELAELRRFFQHPAAAFFRGRAGMVFEKERDLVDDDEPFALDRLAAWKVRSSLLDEVAAVGEPLDEHEPPPIWRRRGVLPPPPLDRVVWPEVAKPVNAILPVVRAWSGETASIDVDLTLDDGHRLVGVVNGVGPSGVRRVHPGRLAMRRLLPDWVDYLALLAAGRLPEGARLEVAGVDGADVDVRRAEVSRDDARELLEDLVATWAAGQAQPLPFHPDLADFYLEKKDSIARSLRKKKPSDGAAAGARALSDAEIEEEAARKALDDVESRLSPGSYRSHHLATDPYLRHALPGSPRLGSDSRRGEFRDLAEGIGETLSSRLVAVGLDDVASAEARHD